ncbi:hypothetical protein GBN32_00210 [Plesiomonas shigelloides]|uniref:baseplate complex protein n=1 Tax=Plesiomonas shigelloides TaxID=703 RepID=UPI0012624D4C|nr:hypothetical protein [Plesiomonas shigelloides]KAB7715696.1 hypothetical protein GBN32_00210 [Plesiomonas shigelloides]
MNQIIILALDGEAILLQNINISVSLRLPEKDMSGQASSTTSAEQGDKAKELRVSGIISFSNEKHLTRIFQLAEAKEVNGAKKCYRIANSTAQAVNMRQGVFAGGVDATEQRDKMAWLVTFTLREKMSVPEKAAARRDSDNKNGYSNISIKQQTQNGAEEVKDENQQSAFWKGIEKFAGGALDYVGMGVHNEEKDKKKEE